MQFMLFIYCFHILAPWYTTFFLSKQYLKVFCLRRKINIDKAGDSMAKPENEFVQYKFA